MRERTCGYQCAVTGCKKREKIRKNEGGEVERSDSEEDYDEESIIKRLFPRTFHR